MNQHNWISVKDKLPDIKISVLIIDGEYKEMHTAEFCDSKFCDEWHISYGKYSHEVLTIDRSKITHWMPLPEFPK